MEEANWEGRTDSDDPAETATRRRRRARCSIVAGRLRRPTSWPWKNAVAALLLLDNPHDDNEVDTEQTEPTTTTIATQEARGVRRVSLLRTPICDEALSPVSGDR